MDEENEFLDYLLRLDEVSVILKTHLRVEQNIDKILSKNFKFPDNLLKWSFTNKINILRAIGILDENFFQKFKKFNDLRNKFSHKYNYKLNSEDINFLESINVNKNLIVPNELKEIPRIKEMTQISSVGAYLEGFLSIHL